MNEEYVSTFVEDREPQSATADSRENHDSETRALEKRTYAFGANRRGQLKTTDLFPKRLWVIAFCGLMLVGIVVAINALSVYAAAWQPLIGDAAAQAISLQGSGTLAGWMMSVLLLLTGLASLQIFALRQHRCDDYGGTYRVWLLVPPIFFIASAASIVDFHSITSHLVLLGQLDWLGEHSLIPMTLKLSLLAVVMVRMLFEVRDSKSASAALVVAWMAVAISTVLNTTWAADRIASQDLALVYPNAVLTATIALFLTHLFYARFVYLHAHGIIAPKQKLKPKKEPKPKTARRPRRTKNTTAKDTNKDTAKKSTAGSGESATPSTASATSAAIAKSAGSSQSTISGSQQASTTSTRSAKRTKQKRQTPPAPEQTISASATSDSSPDSPKRKSTTMSDFQALLKKKQAQQPTAAQTTQVPATQTSSNTTTESAAASVADSSADSSADSTFIPPGKMTKAQRRRARKAAKNGRKAA